MHSKNDGTGKIDATECVQEPSSAPIAGTSHTKQIVRRISIKVQRGIYSVSRNLDSNFRC